jgi:hypothetical protein
VLLELLPPHGDWDEEVSDNDGGSSLETHQNEASQFELRRPERAVRARRRAREGEVKLTGLAVLPVSSLTRPFLSNWMTVPVGVSSAVAVVISTDSERPQREERASPLNPNDRTEVRSAKVVSLEVWCLRAIGTNLSYKQGFGSLQSSRLLTQARIVLLRNP